MILKRIKAWIYENILNRCASCGHSFKNNTHGVDQNDFYTDIKGRVHYMGHCTYCKVCQEEYQKD